MYKSDPKNHRRQYVIWFYSGEGRGSLEHLLEALLERMLQPTRDVGGAAGARAALIHWLWLNLYSRLANTRRDRPEGLSALLTINKRSSSQPD